MKKLLIGMLLIGLPFTTLGDSHEAVEDAIKAMEETFNGSYAENDLDTYFGIYAEHATLIFFGARHSLADYEEEWRAGITAGDTLSATICPICRSRCYQAEKWRSQRFFWTH